MKYNAVLKIGFTISIWFLSVYFGMSEVIPPDSLFLGQQLPGANPKILNLEVTPGSFAAERIAITKNGLELFYSEIKSYYPIVGDNIRYYKFVDKQWSKSQILFEGFSGPALSLTEDTLFMEHNFKMYYSVRTNLKWSSPMPFFNSVDSVHYLQETKNGDFYVSARPGSSVGSSDWCKIQISGKDTIAKSLGFPINRIVDDLDFYIAKDESFMITCSNGPIGISYPDGKGRWLNARYFNEKINFGISGWGAYISSDNKYLFYTTGTKMDYSDVHVYWVKIDNLIDSMKNINLPPYVKYAQKSYNALLGKEFSFTIPQDAIFDEDGVVAKYEVLMLDGDPLPENWSFNPRTKTITGIPNQLGNIILRINGYDDKNEMAAYRFVINVLEK